MSARRPLRLSGRRSLIALSLFSLTFAGATLSAPAQAEAQRRAAGQRAKRAKGPFDKGQFRISGSGGTAGSFGNRYVTVGVGAGYFILKGLELGLDTQLWLGHDPFIADLSPGVRYVFHQTKSKVMPYLGVFYRYMIINDPKIDNISSLGGRGGIYYQISRSGYIGGGVAVETITGCDEKKYGSCYDIYPELAFAFSF